MRAGAVEPQDLPEAFPDLAALRFWQPGKLRIPRRGITHGGRREPPHESHGSRHPFAGERRRPLPLDAEQIGGQRNVPGCRDPAGHVLDVLVDSHDLLDDHDRRQGRLSLGRQREIPHLIPIADPFGSYRHCFLLCLRDGRKYIPQGGG